MKIKFSPSSKTALLSIGPEKEALAWTECFVEIFRGRLEKVVKAIVQIYFLFNQGNVKLEELLTKV